MRPPLLRGAAYSVCLPLLALLHWAQPVVQGAVYHGEKSAVHSYDITYPIWLHHHRHSRSANREHPVETQVVISAEGQQLKLHLQRNEQLLTAGYQEIWYTPDGSRRSSSPVNMNHCLYHGEVLGVEGSSVAVSTCAGLRGIISLNTSVSYLIEPLSAATPQHAVFRAKSVTLPPSNCLQHQNKELENFLQGMTSQQRIRFDKHGSSLDKTKLKLLEAANLVDKYYKALSIRVALIGLEVWTSQDMITVSDNPHSTLAAFLSWRRKQLNVLPNDNAQLITGRSFQGATIGLAPLRAMCSEYQSGGVNTDHSESAVGVAATMAHEMGHNFGMSHDSVGCCQAKDEDGGCIMAAATGHPFPRVFNACNMRELKSYLNSGGGKCLFNVPNTRSMYGGQRCGNGYLEDGEECDCGEEEECTSPCCNANNCTLKAGAECAHGVCCHNCKLKSPGVLCRAPSGQCDLPEYCDGKAEACPANFYLVDGTSCADGEAYCYTGMCLTLEQQCRSLWGQDGRPAPDVCFKKVNEAGDMYGNCGKDVFGKYRSCKDRDAKCGKIQCLSSASKPIESNAVRIETTVSVGNNRVKCMGTHVYKPGQIDEEVQGDTLDPGLVITGTKCGDDSICFNGECRNASFLRADDCHAKCNGHGLCNNNHNCHCENGWAPPLCVQWGAGGSADSGPVIKHSNILPALLVLPLFIFVLLAVGLWCCYKHKLKSLKSPAALPVPSCSVPVEAKSLHTDGHGNGHTNPTFLLKKQDTDQQRKSPPHLRQAHPTRSKLAIVRPTVKPPPVPIHKHEQRRKQAPSPPSGPAPSLSPSDPRPEPPSRPPPTCPVSTPSVQARGQIVTANALLKGKAALAPSAGHKNANRS
ncbi:disintegrin and metalloproteinase domain-containing protein 19 isoform X2 [Dunckerocampus dactyliophorus]|uniref:disintegrin and metalloproteinase domain-containing protein 19 isoform X2 n=1 Tax=Dunckerocampus dactyliophorus TaxID=161453 RepID=UPI002404EC8F|nr:disintegrin and metalloproteinase domain-containing protein 19 isoform X2 [Dunckerocampus dactyliophorus]